MQVKKFEARTMKEALEMVKTQLGPDAIILSARDNARSFGLVGEGSVEITAAVSEETLQKKRFVESRLREEQKEKFQKAPARIQRDVMQKFVNRYQEENAPRRQITQTRYADIDDETTNRPSTYNNRGGYNSNRSSINEETDFVESQIEATDRARVRIRDAAQRAWSTLTLQDGSVEPVVRSEKNQQTTQTKSGTSTTSNVAGKASNSAEIRQILQSENVSSLQQEIAALKQVIAQFSQMPQNFSQQNIAVHPGADFGLSYDFSGVFEKLTNSGVDAELAADLCARCAQALPQAKHKNRSMIEAWIANVILQEAKVTGARVEPKVQAFVGPSASGKTSALVKLAAHMVIHQRKRVAILTTDTAKVGASEQLKIYAQILNVPFAVIRNSEDWNAVAKQLNLVDHVLIDYPGMSLKTENEVSYLRRILPPIGLRADIHLVLSASAKDSDVTEMAKRYQVAQFQNAIFTGLDESTKPGTIYNFAKRFNVPLHSFGIGSRVPEDLEMATAERVLDLLFQISKVEKGAS